MTVVAIGLNHRTAPPSILEKVSFGTERVPKVLAEVAKSEVVSEAVVLATCNRTEVYVRAERFHDGFRDVRDALGLLSGVDPDEFNPYLYVHYHEEAARHLFLVASGLDSAVLGEHEVLGQVGRAWEQARNEKTTGALLNLLFQRAIETGKRVRTDTEISRATASLSHTAVSLLLERRGELDGLQVLLVGAGEVGTGVARALVRKHPVHLRVANRTETRAQELAEELGGAPVPIGDLGTELGRADLVVTATAAPEPVLDVDDVAPHASFRHPLLLLDLAQPRDVPVEVADLPGVELIDLAQVQQHANRGLDARRRHLEAAREVVDAELERYRAASSARQVAPLIGDLHGWADGVRSAELDRYATRLKGMAEADRATVEALSKTLVAKILHHPTVTLREAAGSPRGDRLADAARELFDRP
jgi:glutamyl-tRNA reductase